MLLLSIEDIRDLEELLVNLLQRIDTLLKLKIVGREFSLCESLFSQNQIQSCRTYLLISRTKSLTYHLLSSIGKWRESSTV